MSIDYSYCTTLFDNKGDMVPYFEMKNQDFRDDLVFHPSLLKLETMDVENFYTEYFKLDVDKSDTCKIIRNFIDESNSNFLNYMTLEGDYILYYDTGFWKLGDNNSNIYVGVGIDNLDICLKNNDLKFFYFVINNRDHLLNFHYHKDEEKLNADLFMFNSILPFYDISKIYSNALKKVNFELKNSKKIDIDSMKPLQDYILTGDKFKLNFDYAYYWGSNPSLHSVYMPFFKNDDLLISFSKNTPDFLMAKCHHGFIKEDFENNVDFRFKCFFSDFPSIKLIHGCTLYPNP